MYRERIMLLLTIILAIVAGILVFFLLSLYANSLEKKVPMIGPDYVDFIPPSGEFLSVGGRLDPFRIVMNADDEASLQKVITVTAPITLNNDITIKPDTYAYITNGWQAESIVYPKQNSPILLLSDNHNIAITFETMIAGFAQSRVIKDGDSQEIIAPEEGTEIIAGVTLLTTRIGNQLGLQVAFRPPWYMAVNK